LKNVTAHITKAVLVGKDATEADRVHVCYRDKNGHKFVLCVLRNSIGHDQATLDVKFTNPVGCSMFLQVHNSAKGAASADVKVVLTGYSTPAKEAPKCGWAVTTQTAAVSVPPSPAPVPQTPPSVATK